MSFHYSIVFITPAFSSSLKKRALSGQSQGKRSPKLDLKKQNVKGLPDVLFYQTIVIAKEIAACSIFLLGKSSKNIFYSVSLTEWLTDCNGELA